MTTREGMPDNRNVTHLCPVCGYKLGFFAWQDDGLGSQEICPSCGIQFGYSDAAGGNLKKRKEIHQAWRSKWILDGMPWRSFEESPVGWDPVEQLKQMVAGNGQLITLVVEKRLVHVLYMCIIEHSSTNRFKEEFATTEYTILETLRKELYELRESPTAHVLIIGSKELDVLIRAIPIGLDELDEMEFPTIVGEPYSYGCEVYSMVQKVQNLGNVNRVQLVMS